MARADLRGLVKRVTPWNEKARVELSLPPALDHDIARRIEPNFRAMNWRARGDSTHSPRVEIMVGIPFSRKGRRSLKI